MARAKRSYSRKEYMKLGMILFSEEPLIALRLLSHELVEPIPKDILLIKNYYKVFLEKSENNLKEFDPKIVFIACIINLYQPSAFSNKIEYLQVNYGLSRELRKLITMSKGSASKLIRKAIVWYNVYPDFRGQVKKVMDVLK